MILLRIGDRLPMVAVAQLLLNAYSSAQQQLTVDGIFGTNTEQAVERFQLHARLAQVNGQINQATWERLNRVLNLQIRDSVDVSDDLARQVASTIHSHGGQVLEVGPSSNAVGMIEPMLSSSGVRNNLVLLRFQGHGNNGIQALGFGNGAELREMLCRPNGQRYRGAASRARCQTLRTEIIHSSIGNEALDQPAIVQSFQPLRRHFSPYGSVEFHGCHVARGSSGRRFLTRISNLLGVPATASTHSQGVGNTFRLGGTTFTAYPNGGSLRSWARNLPPIPISYSIRP